MPKSKVIVKLPLDKQVLNNSYPDIHWTVEHDAQLLEIVRSCHVTDDFTVSDINVVELSTQFKVPIDYLLKRFIKIYNEQKLNIENRVEHPHKVVRSIHAVTGGSVGAVTTSVSNIPKNIEDSKVLHQDGTIEVNNGTYSYYIDKKEYSSYGSDDQDEEDDDSDEDEASQLMKSSQFLLHRSKIMPMPKLKASRINDFFEEEDDEDDDEIENEVLEQVIADEEEEETVSPTGYMFYKNRDSPLHALSRTTVPMMTVTQEDVNGIISNKKLNRKGSRTSELSNRSELEKLLLDRL